MQRQTSDAILLIGRLALVAIFVFSGVAKMVDLVGTAQHIASKGLPTPLALAAAAGILEIVAGAMIAIGFRTAIAAAALILFTVVGTFFFHDFWNLPSGREQTREMLNAWKNLSIIGGLAVLAAVGPGRYAYDGRPQGFAARIGSAFR